MDIAALVDCPFGGSLLGLLEEEVMPPSRKLYLVLGAESSGTRLLTRVLVHGGCVGDYSHAQRWDHTSWGNTQNVVWRRSVPHNKQPLILQNLLHKIEPSRVLTVLVTVRDITACARSQVRTGHSPDEFSAHAKITAAYERIFEQLVRQDVHFMLVPYESLILHPQSVQQNLWDTLGLPGGIPVDVTDENRKHYQGDRNV